MTQKLKFAVENITPIEDENLDKSQFSLLRVDTFATGKSLHDTYVTEENLRKYSNTILQKPFVFDIDTRFDDLGTHTTTEVAGGFVPHNSKIDFKTLPDGRVMMSCDVLIWKRYSGKLLEYFERDGGKKGVSVEIEIFESRDDEKTGLLEIINFCFNAITGLGDFISPAIPNAEAIMVFAKEYEFAKNQMMEFGRYDEIDFKIPDEVKQNVKKALESKKGSSVGLALARFISKNEKITPERVRQIYKFFKNKNLSEMDSDMLNLYGGKEGYGWAKELSEKMTEIDEKKLSYFSDVENKNDFSENENKEDKKDMAKEEDIKKEKEEEFANEENKETSEQEKKETPVKEEEKKKERFSYDMFSQEEMAAMFADDEEDDEDSKAKFAAGRDEYAKGENFAVMCHAMKCALARMQKKLAKMEEDKKVYLAENEDLKKKFAEQEEKQKEFAVKTFLQELGEKVVVSEDSYNAMFEKSKEFKFAEIDSWKNHCKAFSFEFKKRGDKEEGEKIVKFALPFEGMTTRTETDNVWDKLSK